MKITDYFIKMKNIADNMAAAGSDLSSDDLILHVLSGLGPDYNSVATYITGQVGVGKMNVNEAYAMLLTQEARIEQQSQMLAGVDMKNNFEANYAQNRGAKKNNMSGGRGFGGYGYGHNSGIGNGGYYKGNFGTDSAGAGAYRPPPNRGPKAAYLANMDAPADTNWYLDSGATHHLTNDMSNMHMAEPFAGYNLLHKGYKCLHSSGKVYIASHVLFDETSFPYSTDPTFLQSMPSKSSDFLYNSLQIYHISVPNSNQNPLEVAPADTYSHASSSTHNIISLPLTTSSVHSTSLHSPNNTIPVATSNTNLAATSNTTPSPTINQTSPDMPLSTSRSLPSPPKSIISTHPMITRAKAGIFKPKAFLTAHNSLEPSNVDEALSDSKWKAAMQDEFDALIRNKTWSLVQMNPEYKLVGCKWVFRTKYNTDGLVSKYKARLVAKGFHQTTGIDYSKTFSPVVKSYTVRVILSLAVMQGWNVRQVDVNNAFLNGDLIEDVYMKQPEGFVSEGGYADTSLFFRHDVKGIILVLIYVDGILITGPDSDLLESFIAKLSKVFALKDLGLVTYFLGVEACYTDHGMHLSQTKYIKDLLSKASMQNCKETGTPFSTGYKLERSAKGSLGAEFENATLYRSIVGGLQYLILTRTDIAYSVHKLSQYLRYSDADWACDIDDRKSIGAYCIFLGNNLVSWSSKKQAIVAKSSSESEYRALSAASSEISWLQSLFSELNITKLPTPILWCDNLSAGDLARNPVFHSRSKHIELDVHYIRDNVLNKELEVRYIPTEEQVADVLTKPLSFSKYSYFQSKLNVISRPLSLRGDVKEAHMCRMVSEAEDCNTCSLQIQVDDMACQLEPSGFVISCTRED
ncbi:retrovirus-related pol polyprotein from transposon RE2 [Citrus sinensis]|uniref:Retrovirus-related pol polyprotein from transposon RE2 n=1 Tax=Citrus sinensis TaxID=2711 RepID=A0ACB8IK85_CITSI|nr:retrovirus-related pol polyprotein from transposon RE2 [Citrus sinensis]